MDDLPSVLNVGSPPHSRRSAGMRRRSVHDPKETFGLFAAPVLRDRGNQVGDVDEVAVVQVLGDRVARLAVAFSGMFRSR